MAVRQWMWSRLAFLKNTAALCPSTFGGNGLVAQTVIGNEQPLAPASCGYRKWLRVHLGKDRVMERWILITHLASALRDFVAPRYRPEFYYMRGPGPACARRATRL